MVAIPAVSLLAVVVAAIVGLLVAGVWSAVPGVLDKWRKWVGLPKGVREKVEWKATAFLFVSLLIMAYILGVFIKLIVPSGGTYVDGLELGFLLWLGNVAMVNLLNWVGEKRPVNAAAASWLTWYLAAYLAMGAILGVWA